MTKIAHHPSPETLAAYAAGTLDEARALIVRMHLSLCNDCSSEAGRYEAVGGALLDAARPAPLRPGALDDTLRRLDAEVGDEPAGQPEPLAAYRLGRWRWVGPGVYRRSVSVPQRESVKVFMLKAAPGTRLPRHRHGGTEWTCVLEGAFEHAFGRYGPGDFDEADESMEHHPTVAAGVPCICIVALEGNIKLQSRLGRLLQPLIRL